MQGLIYVNAGSLDVQVVSLCSSAVTVCRLVVHSVFSFAGIRGWDQGKCVNVNRKGLFTDRVYPPQTLPKRIEPPERERLTSLTDI